jgi:hypothetical protein
MMVTGGLSDLHDGHDRVQVINIIGLLEVHDTRLHSHGTFSQELSRTILLMQMNQTDWHAAYGSLWEYQPHVADGSLCHEHDLSKK